MKNITSLFQTPNSLIVFNQDQRVVHIGYAPREKIIEIVKRALSGFEQFRVPMTESSVFYLRHFFEEKETKALIEKLKGLDYTPRFMVRYQKNILDNTFTTP